MYFIEKTVEFDKWFRKLKYLRAEAKFCLESNALKMTNILGDFKFVGNGVNELKINYAKGYRIYNKEKDGKVILLLIGGDKSTQQKDIEKAKQILENLKK